MIVNEPTILPLEIDPTRIYDLFVATIGYEQRATYVAEALQIKAERRLALGFLSGHVFNYEKNANWYRDAGFVISHVDDEDFDNHITHALEEVASVRTQRDPEEPLRVCVDISSMTRLRMALLIRRFTAERIHHQVDIDFVYTLAEFSPPPSLASPNTHVGPVLPAFSGWWTAPERSLAAAVGLGYEENKALGAVEHVQASSIWTFMPVSPVPEYTPALHQANRTLLALVPMTNRFEYRVDRPFDTFVALESFAFGITRHSNLIILPFGPKIFALCALIVAVIHPAIAVWRVSGAEEQIDRRSSGIVMGLRALMRSKTAHVIGA